MPSSQSASCAARDRAVGAAVLAGLASRSSAAAAAGRWCRDARGTRRARSRQPAAARRPPHTARPARLDPSRRSGSAPANYPQRERFCQRSCGSLNARTAFTRGRSRRYTGWRREPMSEPAPLPKLPLPLDRAAARRFSAFAIRRARRPPALMAAKGLVPVRGHDQIMMLAQLAADAAADVRDAATRRPEGAAPNVLRPACEAPLPAPRARAAQPTVPRPARRARAHHHQPQHARLHARAHRAQRRAKRCASASPSTKRACSTAPRIIEALYKNRNTRMSTADRLIEFAARNQPRADRHPGVQGSRRGAAGPADPGAERRAAAAGRGLRQDARVRRATGLERGLPGGRHGRRGGQGAVQAAQHADRRDDQGREAAHGDGRQQGRARAARARPQQAGRVRRDFLAADHHRRSRGDRQEQGSQRGDPALHRQQEGLDQGVRGQAQPGVQPEVPGRRLAQIHRPHAPRRAAHADAQPQRSGADPFARASSGSRARKRTELVQPRSSSMSLFGKLLGRRSAAKSASARMGCSRAASSAWPSSPTSARCRRPAQEPDE